VIDAEDNDDEGEDLFGPSVEECSLLERFTSQDNCFSDYAENELLDTFSNAGLNDEKVFELMSAAARRAADAKMRLRDRLEPTRQACCQPEPRSHLL